nr:YIP1 family protein [Candidatus Njordarchaeum guaymaensis]
MKSSHSNDGLKWTKEVLGSYVELVVRPSRVTDHIAEMKPDLPAAFIVVVLSSVLITLAAFIAGGAALEIYQYQISTFLVELLTTPFPSPASITVLDYPVVLLKDIAFFVKIWLVFSVLIFLFMRFLHEKVSLTDTLVFSAWTVSPWAIIGFLFGPLSLLLKFVIPLLYQYVFIFSLLTLAFIVAPAVFIRALATSRSIPVYKATVSYMLSLFVLYVILTLNHADVLFYIVG